MLEIHMNGSNIDNFTKKFSLHKMQFIQFQNGVIRPYCVN